jgi:hypothetical protein
MQFISFPATSLPSRWRPDHQVDSALNGAWTPAQRASWAKSRQVSMRGRLAQASPATTETPTELAISLAGGMAALVGGVALAFGAPRGASTLMWVGILTGTIGGLKLLQTGSKVA